jgi:hypothetical protein
MTHSDCATTGNFWDFDFWVPQPTQDSDLLAQLGFIPGLKEILMLRQVHALEHATVWVLSGVAPTAAKPLSRETLPDNETLGGLSTEQGFFLYGQIKAIELRRAVHQALQRLKQGEWHLAIHPRCGTNVSVSLMLTAGFVLGAHLLLPRGPLEQLVGLVLATTTAAQIAPDLGRSAQQYLTTSIPFNLELVDISQTRDFWGRPAYFVRVRWHELQ